MASVAVLRMIKAHTPSFSLSLSRCFYLPSLIVFLCHDTYTHYRALAGDA